MVQIISDNPSDWVTWLGEVAEYLSDYPVSRMAIIADSEDSSCQIINFMNCSTSDISYFGHLLQKEAMIHEIKEELGLEDEYWEEEYSE